MTTANIEKVISRKVDKKSGLSTSQILSVFKTELLKNVDKLSTVFPTVILSTNEDNDSILSIRFAVSYKKEMWTDGKAHVSDSTQNIAFKTYGDCKVNMGFGANSAKSGYGCKAIPFNNEMTKPQLKQVIKQSIEQLVSNAYSKHNDFYNLEKKVSSIWINGELTTVKN